MRSVTSTRGRPKLAGGRISKPETRAEPRVPHRPHAEQRHRLREVVAAGAHGGAAPEVDDDAARPVAVVLHVARDHLVGGAPADLPGRPRRDGARIDGVEVAPGRQHVEPAARGAPAGPGATKRPSSAASSAARSAAAQASSRAPTASASRPDGCAGRRRSSRRRAGRRPAEDVQAVADAHLLEVAEPGVEPRAAPSGLVQRRIEAGLGGEAGRRAPVEDRAARGAARGADRAPARSAIFVEQRLELGRRAVRGPPRASGGVRWPMRDGGEPALRLRGLAGVVDDEGIEHRHGPEHGFRRAGVRQRHGLAGQPFERAVRAEMDQRVDALDVRAARGRTRRRRGAAAGSGRGIAGASARAPRSGCRATMRLPARRRGSGRRRPATRRVACGGPRRRPRRRGRPYRAARRARP